MHHEGRSGAPVRPIERIRKAEIAPSISAFLMRSIGRKGAPDRPSWCMAAAPRSAATP